MQEEDSSVERLKKSLYVRNKVPKLKERHAFHDDEFEVSHEWLDEEEKKRREKILSNPDKVLEELHKGHILKDGDDADIFREERYKEGYQKIKQVSEQRVASRVIKVIFFASLLFFLFAAGLAGYFLIGGKNNVSCDNVKINIIGPRSIASGKKLALDVTVVNNNRVPMNATNIEMIFPEGSRDSENSSASITSAKEFVGTINVGEQVRTTARALLFGQEQTETEIKALVSYSIDDSNASFSCEMPYRILIATAPVSLTVHGLEEISSGQELKLEVIVTSNSDEVVPNLRLVVEYPYGFEYISAEPKPSVETNVWEIGDVAPGMERIITLRGVVKGQGTEARAVMLSVGDKDELNGKSIGTIMQKVEHPLLITRPFLELSLTLNEKKDAQIVATLGEEISGVLHWKNTLDSALYDVEIDGVLQGIMLEPSSVTANNGFFRSVDKTIMWTPQTMDDFKVIEPGQEGDLSFTFNTKHFQKGTSVSNPSMGIEFAVTARRTGDNVPVPQNLLGQAKKTILFDTEVFFQAYALHGIGPFVNTGPHPPKVDKETTYTVAMSIENNINDVDSLEVRGELPVNVNWMGNTSPTNEKIVYNPITREIVWSVGKVPRGTGYQNDPKIAYFQVSTTPSISQTHAEIKLFLEPKMQCVDGFTKNVLKRDVVWVETNLTNDPYFKDVWGAVEQ